MVLVISSTPTVLGTRRVPALLRGKGIQGISASSYGGQTGAFEDTAPMNVSVFLESQLGPETLNPLGLPLIRILGASGSTLRRGPECHAVWSFKPPVSEGFSFRQHEESWKLVVFWQSSVRKPLPIIGAFVLSCCKSYGSTQEPQKRNPFPR